MGVAGSIMEPPICACVCGCGTGCVGIGRVAGFIGGGEFAPEPKSPSNSLAALTPRVDVGSSSKSMSEVEAEAADCAANWEGMGLAAAA